MRIELITTGDELLSGNITDSNAAWLADQCWMLGHQVQRKATVGDVAADIQDVCRQAASRADAVIVTGGMGATTDDITVESAAAAFGVPLVLHDDILQEIYTYFTSRGRPCSENNKRQAMLPEGAVPLRNPIGTAPGVQWTVGQATFFFLPGVPKEMKQLFTLYTLPWLQARADDPYTEHRLHCVGMPEASMDQLLRAVDLGPIRLSYRAQFPEVTLKVIGRGAQAAADVTHAVALIRQTLKEVVYGEGDCSLPQAVGDLLVSRGETIAVAESCTGGYLSNQLTNIPGASRYFERAAVTYSNRAKEQWTSVDPTIIDRAGAVSRDCAEAMAVGVRQVAGTSYGLAVTGIAGPTGGTPEKPVGTVFVALAHAGGVEIREHHFPQGREWFKAYVSCAALNQLRLHLLVPGTSRK